MKKLMLFVAVVVMGALPCLSHSAPANLKKPAARLAPLSRNWMTTPSLPDLKLNFYQSTDNQDDVVFNWKINNVFKSAGLIDISVQDGSPDDFGDDAAQFDQTTRDALSAALKNYAKYVQFMAGKLTDVLYFFNVQSNFYAVVYDTNGGEMNTPTQPLRLSDAKKCVPSTDYYADDVTFYFQLVAYTPAQRAQLGWLPLANINDSKIYRNETHGYFKVLLDNTCHLKMLDFAPPLRVTVGNTVPVLDTEVKLLSGSRFITPRLKELIETLAQRGFPGGPAGN